MKWNILLASTLVLGFVAGCGQDLTAPASTSTPGSSSNTPCYDSTFGNCGIVTLTPTSTPSFNGTVQRVLIQADDKILVAGQENIGDQSVYSILRFNTDGSIDTTFGTNGKLQPVLPGSSTYLNVGRDVVVDSSDLIYVGGAVETITPPMSTSDAWYILRYTTAGILDTSFNTTGELEVSGAGSLFSAGTFTLADLAIQPADQNLVITGNYAAGAGAYPQAALARYLTTDGSVDTTGFATGTANIAAHTFNPSAPADESDSVSTLLVTSTGQIVVIGTGCVPNVSANPICTVTLIQFNSDGTFDSTFNSSTGAATTAARSVGTVLAQSDGTILAGLSFYGLNVLMQFNSDGTTDTTYGVNGEAPSYSSKFALQSSGKALVLTRGDRDAMGLARIDTEGNADTTYGLQSFPTVTPSYSDLTSPAALLVQPADGNVVLAGSTGALVPGTQAPSLILIRAATDQN